MTRRKHTTADAVIKPNARVPWWTGVVLALVSFIALHLVVGGYIGPSDDSGALGTAIASQRFRTIAGILQWLLPALFLAGAAISVLKKRRRRASRHDTVVAHGAPRTLAQMSWAEVEKVVNEYFRRRDFSVTETVRASPDGGIDLVLTRRDEYYLARCRHWHDVTVGVETVRELYAVMTARHAAGGFVVTSGSFTAEAGKFVEGREIELIDGERLMATTTQARRAAPGASAG